MLGIRQPAMQVGGALGCLLAPCVHLLAARLQLSFLFLSPIRPGDVSYLVYVSSTVHKNEVNDSNSTSYYDVFVALESCCILASV